MEYLRKEHRDVDALRSLREVDRTAEQLTQRLTSPGVPFDPTRRENKVIVNFDLPGVAEDSIDLTVERNVLTLKAERGIDWQDDDEVIENEERCGTFSRQLFLGDTLDTSKVEASYDRGVPTVTIPVAETAEPRKVATNNKLGVVKRMGPRIRQCRKRPRPRRPTPLPRRGSITGRTKRADHQACRVAGVYVHEARYAK